MHYAYTAIFSKIFLKEKQREEDVEGSKKFCWTATPLDFFLNVYAVLFALVMFLLLLLLLLLLSRARSLKKLVLVKLIRFNAFSFKYHLL